MATKSENEVIIRWDESDDTIVIYSTSPAFNKRMEPLEERGALVLKKCDDYSKEWTCSQQDIVVKIRTPRNYTDEQKLELVSRMKRPGA